jgi:hypothetical protein
MVCEHHEALIQSVKSIVRAQEAANGGLKEATKALAEGGKAFENIKTRLSLVERIVLGACGLILVGFVVAVVSLIIR